MSIPEGWKPGQRFDASLSVVLANWGANYVVETKNVSDTGLCLRSTETFPVGTQLHLVFGQPPELPRLRAQGIVRWSEDGKGVGVQFTSISPDNQMTLMRFVNSQSRKVQV